MVIGFGMRTSCSFNNNPHLNSNQLFEILNYYSYQFSHEISMIAQGFRTKNVLTTKVSKPRLPN